MKVAEFLEGNLWAILCGGLALYSGYVTGQSDQKNKIDQLNRDLLTMQKALEQQQRIDRCLLFHATRLETGHTGQVPNC